jgi:hypothetical protein
MSQLLKLFRDLTLRWGSGQSEARGLEKLYAFRTGTLSEKVKIGDAGSTASHPFAKNAKEWGTLFNGCAKVGQPPLCEGRESGMPAQRWIDYDAPASKTNQIAQAASPPTLAKNARMGHPLWEWCRRTS